MSSQSRAPEKEIGLAHVDLEWHMLVPLWLSAAHDWLSLEVNVSGTLHNDISLASFDDSVSIEI